MPKNVNIAAMIDRAAQFAPSAEYMYIPMHENTGTAFNIYWR